MCKAVFEGCGTQVKQDSAVPAGRVRTSPALYNLVVGSVIILQESGVTPSAALQQCPQQKLLRRQHYF